jgi:hypothetical protein
MLEIEDCQYMSYLFEYQVYFNGITLEEELKDSRVLSVASRMRYLAGMVAYVDGPIRKLSVGRLALQGNNQNCPLISEF